VRNKARFHLRLKRTVACEVALDEAEHGPGPASSDPTPEQVAEFAEIFAQIVDALDPEERRVLDLRLRQFTTAEIGSNLGCSDRTVRRLQARLRARLEGYLAA